MIIIGITGGMGAGKSLVLSYLGEKWEAHTVRLDDVSRDLLAKHGLCYDETIHIFGREIVKPDGELDRPLIAQKVFEDTVLRDRLNALVHPAVKAHVKWLAESLRKCNTRIMVIEAALLIEGRYDEICDELWYIYADEETRRKRLKESRGYSDERIDGTFASQLADSEFRANVDFIVDNSGDFADAARHIDMHLDVLLGQPEG